MKLPKATDKKNNRLNISKKKFLSEILLMPGALLQFYCSIIILFLFAAAALADDGTNSTKDLTDMPLEALMQIEVPQVFTASKFEQKETEAPSSTTIITSDEIKHYGYRTLADVLGSVPGFYVNNDRNYDFLGTRGVDLGDFNSRFLLLVNGHRVNNDLNDAAYVDTAFILDIDLIDRVEVIRGPGSVLYGNNAFFGVINVITRQGNQVNGAEASASYGTYNAASGRVTLGYQFTNGIMNGLQTLWSGTFYSSDGAENLYYKEYDTPSQNNGVAHDLDGDGFGSFFTTTTFKDFTLEGAFISRGKDNPTAQYLTTFDQPGLTTVDNYGYATLKFQHKFDDDWTASANVYYDRNDFQIGYPSSPSFYEERQSGEWGGGEAQVDKKIFDRHVITVGAEYRDDFKQDRLVFDPSSETTFTSVRQHRLNYGAFAQGDFMIVTNLHADIGARYDQYGHFDPSISPRAAIIYSPLEQTTFKFIYGTAFRDPNFLELSDPRFQDINAEKITSYEGVYEQGIGNNLRSTISGYYNRLNDLIDFQNGSFTNFNADTLGMELALEAKWQNDIRIRASYTLQHTENRRSGIGLPDSPMHLIKFNINAPVYKEKIFAGLEIQYTSSSHTVYSDLAGDTLTGADVPGFATVNFTLFSQNIVQNMDISAGVYNLLNTRYSTPSTPFHLQSQIQQDGISFRIKLTYHF